MIGPHVPFELTAYLLQIAALSSDSSAVNKVLLIVNLALVSLLVVEVADLQSFLLLYELVLVTLIPAMTLSSRSYRRSHALLVLLTLIALCTVVVYLIVATDLLDLDRYLPCEYRITIIAFLYQVIITAKMPTYPLLYWLPEAHVEATWEGSVVLAALILKLSLFGLAMWFLHTTGEAAIYGLAYLAVCSISIAVIAILTSSDLKRIGAYLSIVHMNGIVILLLLLDQASLVTLEFMWAGHSLLAALFFYSIGLLYSTAGTRASIAMRMSFTRTPQLVNLVMVLFILNLGLPCSFLYCAELVSFVVLSRCVQWWMSIILAWVSVAYALALTLAVTRQLLPTDHRIANEDATCYSLMVWSYSAVQVITMVSL